jgi:hypothetical protein
MKSYKREIAAYLIALWSGLTIKVFFYTEDVTALGSILSGLTPFVLVPALAVFGFHAHMNRDK